MYLILCIITEVEVRDQLAHLGCLATHCVMKVLLMSNSSPESFALWLILLARIGIDWPLRATRQLWIYNKLETREQVLLQLRTLRICRSNNICESESEFTILSSAYLMISSVGGLLGWWMLTARLNSASTSSTSVGKQKWQMTWALIPRSDEIFPNNSKLRPSLLSLMSHTQMFRFKTWGIGIAPCINSSINLEAKRWIIPNNVRS